MRPSDSLGWSKNASSARHVTHATQFPLWCNALGVKMAKTRSEAEAFEVLGEWSKPP